MTGVGISRGPQVNFQFGQIVLHAGHEGKGLISNVDINTPGTCTQQPYQDQLPVTFIKKVTAQITMGIKKLKNWKIQLGAMPPLMAFARKSFLYLHPLCTC